MNVGAAADPLRGQSAHVMLVMSPTVQCRLLLLPACYLPSRRAPPPPGPYQIILLCVWTT